ncbi:MAG: heavy-metal-associated domain-containing protein [Deltaproteobacteria bacterium]|nr:MAG: heavy-metal-associated domain-containing protein [Deltaproteobacteria bacterium]
MKVKIEGMTCQHCVNAVTKALKSLPGVVSVRVSLEEKQAVIEGNPDPEKVLEAIREEGYEASVESS